MNNPMQGIWKRLQWRVAYFIDAHSELCWVDIVSLVVYGLEHSGFAFHDGYASSSRCVEESIKDGSCYCGKFKNGKLAKDER